MRKTGNPEDAEYLRDARATLGSLSQPVFGALVGLSQSGVSHIENQWTPLSPVVRREVERALARHRALELLNAGGWQIGVAPCPEANRLADLDVDLLMRHAEACPVCLARLSSLLPST